MPRSSSSSVRGGFHAEYAAVIAHRASSAPANFPPPVVDMQAALGPDQRVRVMFMIENIPVCERLHVLKP